MLEESMMHCRYPKRDGTAKPDKKTSKNRFCTAISSQKLVVQINDKSSKSKRNEKIGPYPSFHCPV